MGAITAVLGLGWFVICTQVILPSHHGLTISPFLHRLAVFGPTLEESLRNFVGEPALLLRWLRQPEIVSYLIGLLASAGFTSLFSPLVLALSAPVVALNVFSTWNWTYSEGAHYSASIVPFLIVSAIYGVDVLARQISKLRQVPYHRAVHALAVLVLLASGIHHYLIGISPLARSYHAPSITAHHRLGKEIMARIPPDAALSAQSGLYPHVAHREKAYLFPAINDAQYVFLDVTSSSYPISLKELSWEVQWLLDSRDFAVLAAEDGYLLLQRDPAGQSMPRLPKEFTSFARAGEDGPSHRLRVRFGDALELVGYDYTIRSVVHAQQLPVAVTTCWRALTLLDRDYKFTFFFTRADGAIVGHYDGGTPTGLWYSPRGWKAGEVVCMETPALPIGRLRDVLLAVSQPLADPWSLDDRLQPITSANDQLVQTVEQGSLLKLFSFADAEWGL
jgi:hypothetical protein